MPRTCIPKTSAICGIVTFGSCTMISTIFLGVPFNVLFNELPPELVSSAFWSVSSVGLKQRKFDLQR